MVARKSASPLLKVMRNHSLMMLAEGGMCGWNADAIAAATNKYAAFFTRALLTCSL